MVDNSLCMEESTFVTNVNSRDKNDKNETLGMKMTIHPNLEGCNLYFSLFHFCVGVLGRGWGGVIIDIYGHMVLFVYLFNV